MKFEVRLYGHDFRLVSQVISPDPGQTDGGHEHFAKANELGKFHSSLDAMTVKHLTELVDYARSTAQKTGWATWNQRVIEVCEPILDKIKSNG